MTIKFAREDKAGRVGIPFEKWTVVPGRSGAWGRESLLDASYHARVRFLWASLGRRKLIPSVQVIPYFGPGHFGREFGQAIGLGESAIVVTRPERAYITNNHEIVRPKGTKPFRTLRTENGDHRNAERIGQVGGAAVVTDNLGGATEHREQPGQAQPVKGMIGQVRQSTAITIRVRDEHQLKIKFFPQPHDDFAEVSLGPSSHGDPCPGVKDDHRTGVGSQPGTEFRGEGGIGRQSWWKAGLRRTAQVSLQLPPVFDPVGIGVADREGFIEKPFAQWS